MNDLAAIADRMLAPMPQDRTYPYQSRIWFWRKGARLRWIINRSHRPRIQGLTFVARSFLGSAYLRDLIAAASLSKPQRVVLALRIWGHTFAEIGALIGRTRQRAQQIYAQVIRTLRIARRSNPWTGLSEAYAEMVSPRSDAEYYAVEEP